MNDSGGIGRENDMETGIDGPTEGDFDYEPLTPAEQAQFLAEFASADAEPITRLTPLENEKLQWLVQERVLRERYAKWCFWMLVGQLAFMNVLLVLLGCKVLCFTDWLFHVYLVGTFGEAAAIVIVITSSIFPKRPPVETPVR